MARMAELARERARGGDGIVAIRAVSRLVRALIEGVAKGLSRHARDRRVLRRLSTMSDRELQDIGLTRGDVVDAASLPRNDDASLLLVRRRDERRGNRLR